PRSLASWIVYETSDSDPIAMSRKRRNSPLPRLAAPSAMFAATDDAYPNDDCITETSHVGSNPCRARLFSPTVRPSDCPTVSFYLSELRDVFRQGLVRRGGVLALHHRADLLDHVRVRERRHVADVAAIGDGREHAAHDLAGARLGHVRHDVHVFGARDLADHLFVRLDHAVHDLLAGLDAGLDRDVHLGHPSLHLVLHGHHGRLGDLWNRETRGLDLLRAEAVTGDVDHVVNAAEDAEVAVGRLHRAVAAQERPVAPVLALGILIVLGEIGLDVAVAVAPDRLHDPGPGF